MACIDASPHPLHHPRDTEIIESKVMSQCHDADVTREVRRRHRKLIYASTASLSPNALRIAHQHRAQAEQQRQRRQKYLSEYNDDVTLRRWQQTASGEILDEQQRRRVRQQQEQEDNDRAANRPLHERQRLLQNLRQQSMTSTSATSPAQPARRPSSTPSEPQHEPKRQKMTAATTQRSSAAPSTTPASPQRPVTRSQALAQKLTDITVRLVQQDITHQEAGGLLAQTVQEAVAASRKLIREDFRKKFFDYKKAATDEIQRLKALLDAPRPSEQVQPTVDPPSTAQPVANELTATAPSTNQSTATESTATAPPTSQPTTTETTATAPSTSKSTAIESTATLQSTDQPTTHPPTTAAVSTPHESTATVPSTGPPLAERSMTSAVTESTTAPPATTAPAPQQVVPAEGPAPVSAMRAESSSTPPRSLSIDRASDSGHDTSSSSSSSSSSPSDRSMVHVTPDVVVRADALTAAPSTSGTVAPPVDDQHPRSPSPQIDQFPSPPSSPPRLTIAQVRQPLPPVQTFLTPPVVSRQLETKLPVLRARQPAM